MSWSRYSDAARLVLAVSVVAVAAVLVWFGANFTRADAQEKLGKSPREAKNPVASTAGACIAGTGVGAIPDNDPANPLEISYAVSGLTGSALDVGIDLNADHTWVGDTTVTLESPGGTVSHIIYERPGVPATDFGSDSDLVQANTYQFIDITSGDWWLATETDPVPAGDYRASAPATGAPTSITDAFSGLSDLNGVWKLKVSDSAGGDVGEVVATCLYITAGTPPTVQPAPFDSDGDGKTDYSIVRDATPPLSGSPRAPAGRRSINESIGDPGFKPLEPAGGNNLGNGPAPGSDLVWYISNSGDGTARVDGFGDPNTDFWIPGDCDGDEKADLVVWRGVAATGPGGAYFICFESATSTVATLDFGQIGDNPTVAGDYDGDGIDDAAVFRCPTGGGQCTFFYQGSSGGGEITYFDWGNGEGIRPYPGDFDGDGKYDFCVFDDGLYTLYRSSDGGVEYINWGLSSDAVLAPGDYDGDGKTDFMNIRVNGSDVEWWLYDRNGNASATVWGALIAGFVEFVAHGDFDGDGATDIGIWRRDESSNDNSFFYTLRSSDSMLQTFEWGSMGDAPVPGFNAN